jgi:hypothetical protein
MDLSSSFTSEESEPEKVQMRATAFKKKPADGILVVDSIYF